MPLPELTVFTPVVYCDQPGTIGGFATTGGFAINLTPTRSTETLVGDSDLLTAFAVGGGNTLSVTDMDGVSVIGDALTVNGFAHAGGNSVTATSFALGGDAYAAGDAVTLAGFAQGGHNTVDASGGGATAYGDALTMTDHAKGGYNTVSAQNDRHVGTAFGDAGFMSGYASGGHNHLSATDVYGDAYQMSGFAQGGDNTLTGVLAPIADTLYGDAYELSGSAHGGGNTLIAPDGELGGPNLLYGDGYELLGSASGGGNTLIAGKFGNDVLWGGAAIVSPTAQVAPNTFEFQSGLGHNVVMDFRSGEDHIDLQGFGVTTFQQLSSHFQQTAGGLDIVFAPDDDVLLHGVSQVVAGDFVFS